MRFRGLCRPLPEPCANKTTPCGPSRDRQVAFKTHAARFHANGNVVDHRACHRETLPHDSRSKEVVHDSKSVQTPDLPANEEESFTFARFVRQR